MDQNTFHLIVTCINLLGIGVVYAIGYLMRTSIEESKMRQRELSDKLDKQASEIVEVKVHYLLKDDFSEFKEELWRKLDDLKEIVKHHA